MIIVHQPRHTAFAVIATLGLVESNPSGVGRRVRRFR